MTVFSADLFRIFPGLFEGEIVPFSGWVGFDRTMNLKVEIPLSDSLVRRYPQLKKYVGTVMEVPLKGHVQSPRLDYQQVIVDLLKRAAAEAVRDKVGDTILEKAGNLLDGFLKRKKR